MLQQGKDKNDRYINVKQKIFMKYRHSSGRQSKKYGRVACLWCTWGLNQRENVTIELPIMTKKRKLKALLPAKCNNLDHTFLKQILVMKVQKLDYLEV